LDYLSTQVHPIAPAGRLDIRVQNGLLSFVTNVPLVARECSSAVVAWTDAIDLLFSYIGRPATLANEAFLVVERLREIGQSDSGEASEGS
jgi:hypothetical protein